MMEIYNEAMERIYDAEEALGWIERSTRTQHYPAIEAVKEVSHLEVAHVYPNGGRDMRRVIDVPAVEGREAYDEIVAIGIYHPYTEEELAAIEAEKSKPTQEQRIAELEAKNAALEEQIEMLLAGVTADE